MALFESNIQDITQMNISNELKEQLNIGIQYIFSVVTKLQQILLMTNMKYTEI